MLFIIIAALFVSCKKEEKEKNEPEMPKYNGTVDDISKDLDSAYMYLRAKYSIKVYGQQFEKCSPFLISNFITDDAICGGNDDEQDVPFWQDIAKFRTKPNNISVSALWLKYYFGIYHLNKILYNAQLDKYAQKDQVIAEAKFLRAYIQFDMLRFFGAIPALDKYYPASDSISQTVNTVKASFESIVSDLEAAVNGLPVKSALASENYFRPSKGAAHSLLGKVYLYMASPYYNLGNEYYSKAQSALEQVISSGEYKLVDDYGAQFLKAGEFGSESVFEINYTLMPSMDWNNILVNTCNPDPIFIGVRGITGSTAPSGWGFILPREELVTLFVNEKETKRKTGTIIDGSELVKQGGKLSKYPAYNGYFSNKNTLRNDERVLNESFNIETNDRIIRYSDVLLMYAEASLNMGDANKALQYVNMVRSRAGVSALAALTMDDIMKERRLELALEGHRFFDLLRWNKASEKLQFKGFVAGKSEHLPIPEYVLKKYSKLTQNPGY
jgi:hypothetical protein